MNIDPIKCGMKTLAAIRELPIISAPFCVVGRNAFAGLSANSFAKKTATGPGLLIASMAVAVCLRQDMFM
ncbi:hypothetical protein [Cohnella sp. OV330]|uniref:hypothetical protein n=1 Tax=Cohnella sp. OV330 TaxID=1855288 RepID=UPI00116071B8|nr:hypothetical protein [Cohnella sp. OV330]